MGSLLTEMGVRRMQARRNAGMMAKKTGEVNMEEGQRRWPNGQTGWLGAGG